MCIDLLIFSFGFGFVVQLVSRCFFPLTFRVVPLLTSTYVGVLVSVCYPGLPAADLARSIFVTRPKICDGSVFLFLPVKIAPLPKLGLKPAVFSFLLVGLAYPCFAARQAAVVFLLLALPLLSALRTK